MSFSNSNQNSAAAGSSSRRGSAIVDDGLVGVARTRTEDVTTTNFAGVGALNRPPSIARLSASQGNGLLVGGSFNGTGRPGSVSMAPVASAPPATSLERGPLLRLEDERATGRSGDPPRWDPNGLSSSGTSGSSAFALPPRNPARQDSMIAESGQSNESGVGPDSFRRPSIPSRVGSSPLGTRPVPPRIDTASPSRAFSPSSPGKEGPPPVSATVPGEASTASRSGKDRGGSSAVSKKDQTCDACGKPMTGQFVRALGVVYHLDCFRCRDCNKVVAAKFFPATDEMGQSSPSSNSGDSLERKVSPTQPPGKLFPLCETDYFRRLDLICAKCSGALRGSYITALGKKFHVEHFTCSVCPTVFGPQDSYYEHDGQVFCHFHYSSRFAIRCTGCRTAILKQFVEINRNNRDEHWHPECYMIHKFWNIKLCPTGSTPKDSAQIAAEPTTLPGVPEPSNTGVAPASSLSSSADPTPEALETEAHETPASLKHKQRLMEEQVYRIWTVLSAFEESSAACISDMLRNVSSGKYLGGVRMAERFILHVEILFSAIDDLEREARREGAKGISHIREARMLCKKIVNFFSLLSHTQETGAQRMGITQELLSLVTGLAHYLKILIRIALTGALKLDREHDNKKAISWFLDQLAFLAREGHTDGDGDGSQGAKSPLSASGHGSSASHGDTADDGRPYGYRSLPRSTSTSNSEGGESATDLCVACSQTVEEECARMGINLRWHMSCLRCKTCRRAVQREPGSSSRSKVPEPEPSPDAPEALPMGQFALESSRRGLENASALTASAALPSTGSTSSSGAVHSPFCPTCAPASVRHGFEPVTRLEQYAFLLRVALNRLYALLKKRGVVPASPPVSRQAELVPETAAQQAHDLYKDEDIKRVKPLALDRKLSTKAKVPHMSTVVGSPSGQHTHTSSMQQRASPTDMAAQQSEPRPSLQQPRSPSPGRWDGQQNQYGPGRSSPQKKLSSSPGTSSRDPSPSRQAAGQAVPAQVSRRPAPAHQPPPVPAQLHQSLSQQQYQQPHAPGAIVPIRPAFARHNTDVRIRDDGPLRQPSGDEVKPHSMDAVTLADIPQLLEAEQLREQRRALPEGVRSIAELSALELFIVKHMAVMMLQQSALKDLVNLDDLIDIIDMRKNTFWGKLFKGGKDDKKVKKKGVFAIPLEILVERSGADSTLGASATQLRVPSFIDDIVSAMRQMDMSIEGIFRKNGNIRRLATSAEALDRDSTQVNLSDDNPVQLAALLKKFLRELPDPLLTFKLHRLFVMSQKLEPESERRRIMHLLTVLLPKPHRDTMEVLFVFLKWVASFSHIDEETGSKMDLQNLATVLGPNILYSKGTDPAKDETFLANRAVLDLLEHQDDYWLVPPGLDVALQDRDLLNSSAELTSRDILKKCEKHAKRVRATTVSTPHYARPVAVPAQGANRWGDSDSHRHQPHLHAPPSMRAIGAADYSSSFGRSQGSNGHGSYPRSPVSDDQPHRQPMPWTPAHGAHTSGQGQQGVTPYGSPSQAARDRNGATVEGAFVSGSTSQQQQQQQQQQQGFAAFTGHQTPSRTGTPLYSSAGPSDSNGSSHTHHPSPMEKRPN